MESEDLASKFAMLTGASSSDVDSYLELCNYDIERAINMYMENRSDSGAGSLSTGTVMEDGPVVVGRAARINARRQINDNASGGEQSTNRDPSDEDNVRAPIPQRTEVLVDAPFLPAMHTQRSSRLPSSAFRQPSQSWGTFPSRRDTEPVENSVYNPIVIDNDESETTTTTTSTTTSRRRARKRNLAELFSPPYELIHQGPFDSARDNGRTENKWVLVDVQDSQEFRCQCLNRDLWKNEMVAGILKANFIFWQVNVSDLMGQRFQQFYPVNELPFVGLVDPTTGELLQTFKRLSSPEEFIDDLWEFLSKNPNPTCNNLTLGSAPKRMRRDEDVNQEVKIEDKVNDMKITESNLSDLSEAEQLRVAMERSREHFMSTPASSSYTSPPSESAGQLTDSDTTDSLLNAREPSPLGPSPSLDDDDRNAASSELEETIRHAHDPSRVCQLVVRLPQGERQTVTLPASAPIKALKLFAESCGYSSESNELVALHPFRNLSQMKAFASLESAKLYPKDTVFVQEK